VQAKKIAEEYFNFKPCFNESFPNFPPHDITLDTPPDYYVEFSCQLEGGRGIANFVRMWAAS
jgi:hypothetical protein